MNKIQKVPEIILLIETSREFGRGLLAGIARYSRIYGPLRFCRYPPYYLYPYDDRKIYRWIKQQRADGIIMRRSKNTDQILALKIPIIILDVNKEIEDHPNIVTDDQNIGRIAAEYFISRRFKEFAFCGFSNMLWSQKRCEGFCAALGKTGIIPYIYNLPRRSWKSEIPVLIEWLKKLPQPVALMACNDDRGQEIIEACRAANLYIPEQVAVLGVDNDTLVCDLTEPTLSSIAINTEKAGFEAAQLITKLVFGEAASVNKILAEPTHVVTRRSTDITMVDDNDVAKALRFISEHSRDRIQIEDVVEAVKISRRGLYKKFKRTIGRSVHDEITIVQIEHIKKMLRETNLSISHIASQLKYSGVEKLARFFRRETGITPIEYRKSIRH